MLLPLRPSDRDRRRAVAALQRGYAEGRLSTGTFEARLELAHSAPTTDALRGLLRDLHGRWLALDAVASAILRARPRSSPRAEVWATLMLSRATTGRVLIGRAPTCDVVLDDPSVSRLHARLQRIDGRWFVRDLDSTNGTRTERGATQFAAVEPGSRLVFGRAVVDLV